MQCALKIIYAFSVIIHQNIDPKSTENPATWRGARMHDFGISICCGQNHRQKKHRVHGVLSFALTPRSGGLGRYHGTFEIHVPHVPRYMYLRTSRARMCMFVNLKQ